MAAARQTPRWLEPEVWLLVLLVGLIYFSRLTTLTLRGEEPRRAMVSYQMLEDGDWVVPKMQGEPWLSRPPLHNWVIALVAMATGDVDPIAIRFPSVLATLLTTLLVYGYARWFLPPLGAFAAGASFATMGHVLELGRLGETEALFTLLLGGALLLWHAGYERGWPAAWTWVVGYGLAALATLAKAPQVPVYFAGSVGLFLILRREWRRLFTGAHLAGLLAFAVIFGAWQIPLYLRLGWQGVREIWFWEVGLRFIGHTVATVAMHLVSYPFEFFIALLPWSLLLSCFMFRGFRDRLEDARSPVAFLTISVLIAIPTVWLAPGARGRYLMPVYPGLAFLIGLVVQRSSESPGGTPWRRVWEWYLRSMAGVMVAAGLAVLSLSLLANPDEVAWAQPPLFALAYALVGVAAAPVLFRVSRRGGAPVGARVAILLVAGFMGLTFTGVLINKHLNTSVDTASAVARLKQELPHGHRLVSVTPVHPLFVYYYRDPIALVAWPDGGSILEAEGAYFCFNRVPGIEVRIPFPWEEVAAVSVARSRVSRSQQDVVIGRRLPGASGTAPPSGGAPRR
ncbi:MAG TPA: glycosyltransferase family 39 protein [Candidatus Methylomirabilis sp.]|jgi:4-amino-4-deoxy-L-arabinose transferase-like glycosyltransferase|nr:glycosyltransferase family 39 protein [Candidatus Methylomirabilis sp.]